MTRYPFLILMVCSAAVAGCTTTGAAEPQLKPAAAAHAAHAADEPRPYLAEANARAEVDAALLSAKESGKMTIVAMGANWCHDSRGLAAQFEKPRFQTLLNDNYELVYVDVGKKDRNIDIAREFGVEEIFGTPTVFVVSGDGEVLNLETAPTWRNAASRSEGEVYDYFEGFTGKKAD